MKQLLKKIIPKKILFSYHYFLAVCAHWFYGRPSEKLVVIGVTGTSGKSTTIQLISAILEHAGFQVGVSSTIQFKVGHKEKLNNRKMTMVGRFELQKLLWQMVKASCQYAIIETTSEGIAQYRHIGIHYDVCVCTNLYPEHIESHGNFENYKKAKLELFKKLEKDRHKVLNTPRKREIAKVIVVNLDDEYAPEFLSFDVDNKYGFTTKASYDISGVKELRAEIVEPIPSPLLSQDKDKGFIFRIDGTEIHLKISGAHNVSNAQAAYAVGLSQGVNPSVMKTALESIHMIPGRIEFIDCGQKFTVIVDYAFEPRAMQSLYDVVARMGNKRRAIHVLGTTGGGRDRTRGRILGNMAGQFADVVVVTNEDPYDDDPQELMRRVSAGAKLSGKIQGRNLFEILDRRHAMRKAIRLASRGDVILITGKGCEQAIVVKNNKKIPWDDRKVVREELERFGHVDNLDKFL